MTLRMLTSITSFALSLGLIACTGDDKGDDSDTAASTSGDTETTGATTGTDGTAGTAGTGSASATSTDGMTAGTTTAGTTDGTTAGTTAATTTAGTTDSTGGDGSIPASCEAACATIYGCFPEEYESMAACVELCVDETTPREPDPGCEGAAVAFNECLAGLTCQQLVDEEDLTCMAELLALEEACDFGGEECINSAGGDAQSCGISEMCRGSSLSFECEGELCRCIEDDVEVATCNNDVCADELDFELLSQRAFECCGWEL